MLEPPVDFHGLKLDAKTGLPAYFAPFQIDVSCRWTTVEGTDKEFRPIGMAVHAMQCAISTHPGDIDRQAQTTGQVIRHLPKGSEWLTEVSIRRMPSGSEAVVLDLDFLFPPETHPQDSLTAEIENAMAPVWAAWWLSDQDAELMECPPPIAAGAALLISMGTEWRTAVAMAALEDEQTARGRHSKLQDN